MARKRVPDTSRITRAQTVAYARKQRSDDDKESKAKPDEALAEAHDKPDIKDGAPFATLEAKADAAQGEPVPVEKPAAPDAQAEPEVKDAAPFALPPDDAPSRETVVDLRAAAVSGRARAETMSMPAQLPIGSPPSMPAPAPGPMPPPSRLDAGAVEDPTFLPGAREIPPGSPDDPAPPPGRVPPGDSRSLRKRSDTYEFALIYRRTTFIITRFGLVGTRGQWRVVEYPTSAAASHAYAKECSRFVSEGFSDYRD